jgi:DegV family protein with EDD domain
MQIQIITDSACDLPKKIVNELDIKVLPLFVRVDGEEYEDGYTIETEYVYKRMREGFVPTTAQVSLEKFRECFTDCAEQKKVCIYIGFSSGLSGTYNASTLVEQEVKEKYKEFDLTTIDTKCASMGFGLVVYKAARMAKKGASKDEIIECVKRFSNKMEHIFTVDTFDTLVKGGRVTKTKGFIGNLLKIKPILNVEDGKLVPIEKARGNSKAFKKMIEIIGDRGEDLENQVFGISHGDDIEKALTMKKMLEETFGTKEFVISQIGSVIGSHSGPGCLALFFLNEKQSEY